MTVSQLWADHIATAAVFAVIGLSLNIVLGYTGQVSLGHHAFVGLGAFLSAYWVTERSGCTPEAGCANAPMGAFLTGIFVAILSGLIAAGILGMIALRIKGLYLALITLTYGFVAVNSLFEVPFLTRGGAGMPAPRPLPLATDRAYMWFCIGAVAVCLIIDWRLLASKAGRAILAVKESEAVASTYAINVTVYKLMAFMLSGAFAGLAGALFAYRRQIVVAVDFSFATALVWVLMVVVGGLGSRLGVVIGSAFFALFAFLVALIGPLEDFVHETLNRDAEELVLVIGPLLALFTMISFPGGIAEQISPITRWLGGEKFSMHPEGKQKKPHVGLLVKLGIKKPKHEAAPEAALEGPKGSAELLGGTSRPSLSGTDKNLAFVEAEERSAGDGTSREAG
jgi:branched-chain amino acid transport system permease protein